MTFAVAFPVLVSIAVNAAATSEPDPLISIALLTVIAPVIAVLIVAISVAWISVVAPSLIVIVPVLVVTVPAKAASISATSPDKLAVGAARTIAPLPLSLIVFSCATV